MIETEILSSQAREEISLWRLGEETQRWLR
jgi:hypothetical protein